ncbi:MAG: lipid-A-disaccharide synthase [Hydrogenovibrio sp.]|uniref:lipid-A-disaccharide synthase n=1 Tax=Hydrogenovibrio sp. TaxID=2065821 RepID=UPI002870686C|nr:lipid-A-disaccharide synthase [Hydrogenovibrio sp.]MDR9497635.1 lipid-A-disaccharide synthase [Hydrogenovibrio sp.]
MALSAELTAPSPVFALVAGETSGDQLGAGVIAALKQRFPQARFVGIGGPAMMAQGMESWYPMSRLSVMGLFEVLKHLPGLVKIRKQLIRRLIELNPTAFIGIDAPDFNFTVEEKLKSHNIPAFHYVGPSVWAWREQRLKKIREQVDGVFVLFPFEPPLYWHYGICAKYVGHYMAAETRNAPSKAAARVEWQLPESISVTGLLPGSRASEIATMMPIYLQAATLLLAKYPTMQFVIPAVHAQAQSRIEGLLANLSAQQRAHFQVRTGQVETAIAASDQLMVTSGTATLQTALMQRPFVLAIKVHPVSYWLMKRLATTDWVGLPNVLAQQPVVPELIQQEATAANLVRALTPLIDDAEVRAQQCAHFARQRDQLDLASSDLVAETLMDWLPGLRASAQGDS